jgi:epsilon-lactone hydrolase
MEPGEIEPPPHTRAPSPQSRVLVTAVRLGVRPFSARVPGHRPAILLWRAVLNGGSRFLRADPRASVQSLGKRGEWVRPRDPSGEGAVLYLHGGGYALCSPQTHRALTSRLAVQTGLPVLVPMYRRAPEHPFPAAFEDALGAYRMLLDSGVPADRIVVGGDSAGGHLAAALAGEACRTGLPAPAGVVLFSPWVDLRCEISAAAEHRDPYISPGVAERFGRLYVGGADWNDPRLSLLDCATDRLPPFLIQVGGIEMLRADAERFAEALRQADVPCELQVWPGQMHVFQVWGGVLPEGREAIRAAARFIRTTTGAPTTAVAA